MKQKQTLEFESFEAGDVIRSMYSNSQHFILSDDGQYYRLLWYKNGKFTTWYCEKAEMHRRYRNGDVVFEEHIYNQVCWEE